MYDQREKYDSFLYINGCRYAVFMLNIHHALNDAFSCQLKCLWPDDSVPVSAIGTHVHIEVIGENTYHFCGVIKACTFGELQPPSQQIVYYTLVAQLATLQLTGGMHLYANTQVKAVCQSLLKKCGYQDSQIIWRLQCASQSPLDYIQGPEESDYDFFQRLLAEQGWLYYCGCKQQQSVIIITDEQTKLHSPIDTPLQFSDNSGLVATGISEQQWQYRVPLAKAAVLSYNPHLEQPAIESITASELQTQYHHFAVESNHTAATLAKRIDDANQSDSEILTIKTNVAGLTPGHCITLHINNTHQNFLVIELEHEWHQAPATTWQHNLHYRNTVRLIKSTKKYRMPIPPAVTLPPFTLATVAKPFNQASTIDQFGYYHVTYDFDQYQQTPARTLALLTPFAESRQQDKASGWHFPLLAGTTVVLSFIDHCPSQAVIIGSLPTAEYCSPVNSRNAGDYIIATPGGNQLCFRDNDEAPLIKANTANEENKIELNANKKSPFLLVQSKYGNIHYDANGNFNHNSSKNILHRIGGKMWLYSQQMMTVKAQNISLQAKDNINLVSDEMINIDSGEISCLSHDTMKLSSAGELLIDCQGDYTLVETDNDIYINAKEMINIQAQGELHLQAGASSIVLAESGDITLSGQVIDLSADSIGLNGKIIKQDMPPVALSNSRCAPTVANSVPLILRSNSERITNLSWDCHWLPLKQDVIMKFQVAGFAKGDIAHCDIFEDDGDDKTIIGRKQYCLSDGDGVVNVPWNFSKSATFGSSKSRIKTTNELTKKLALPHQYYFRVRINNQHSNLSDTCYLLTTLVIKPQSNLRCSPRVMMWATLRSYMAQANNPQHLLTRDYYAKINNNKIIFNEIPIGVVRLQLFQHRPSIAGIGAHEVDSQFNPHAICCEIINEQKSYPAAACEFTILANSQAQQKRVINYIDSYVLCNLRDDAKPSDVDRRWQLTKAEIDYFRTNGNRVMVFIHGYNVPYGKFSDYFSQCDIEVSHKINFIDNTIACTLYRDVDYLKIMHPHLQHFDDKELSAIIQHQHINAQDAHSWVLAIERNLNQAAGFDKHHYSKFTRVLCISWQGDPDTPADYMDAVLHVPKAATKLTEIFKQLINAGLDVYALAHSLGNGVLVTAMNNLGLEPMRHYQEKIKQVFLWDAAIPNNVLSNRNIEHYGSFRQQREQARKEYLNNRWYLPFASQAAKKISVLYSHNDNILGPIPTKQLPGLKQNDIDKAKPFYELACGLVLTALELQSVYELGTWVGVPATALLHRSVQEALYQHWRKGHQPNQTYCQQQQRAMMDGYQQEEVMLATAQPGIFPVSMLPPPHERCHFPATLAEQTALSEQQNHAFFTQLKDKIKTNTPMIIKRILQANYKVKDKKVDGDVKKIVTNLHYAEIFVEDLFFTVNTLTGDLAINLAQAYFHLSSLATLVTTILYDTDYEPRPALGYWGISKDTDKNHKIHSYNITKWMWFHSALKYPSSDLMSKVYERIVFGLEHLKFGDYDD